MLARDLGRENVADFAASSLDVKSRRITKLSALSKTKIDSDDNEDSHASAEAVESKKERVSAASSVSVSAIRAPSVKELGEGTTSVSLLQETDAAAKTATAKRMFFMLFGFSMQRCTMRRFLLQMYNTKSLKSTLFRMPLGKNQKVFCKV